MPEMLNPVQPASLETQADRAVLKARVAEDTPSNPVRPLFCFENMPRKEIHITGKA